MASPEIENLEFGEVTIGGKTYYSDIYINVFGKVEHITKKHRWGLDEIKPLLEGNPSCIVIGKGMEGAVSLETRMIGILKEKKISLFVDSTRNAVDIYNGLVADKKKVAGIFHLTS